jgi:hypothetical protein
MPSHSQPPSGLSTPQTLLLAVLSGKLTTPFLTLTDVALRLVSEVGCTFLNEYAASLASFSFDSGSYIESAPRPPTNVGLILPPVHWPWFPGDLPSGRYYRSCRYASLVSCLLPRLSDLDLPTVPQISRVGLTDTSSKLSNLHCHKSLSSRSVAR